MAKHNNKEFIKIGGSKTVTVTLRYDVEENANESLILRNAAEAANFMANHQVLKVWVRSIEIKE